AGEIDHRLHYMRLPGQEIRLHLIGQGVDVTAPEDLGPEGRDLAVAARGNRRSRQIAAGLRVLAGAQHDLGGAGRIAFGREQRSFLGDATPGSVEIEQGAVLVEQNGLNHGPGVYTGAGCGGGWSTSPY